MFFPIKLTTSFGEDCFNVLDRQYAHYAELGEKSVFQSRCEQDYENQSRYLEYFLDDDIMNKRYQMNEDDVEGWQIFKEQSDLCGCLKFFVERV